MSLELYSIVGLHINIFQEVKCIFALPLDWVKTKDKETLSIIVQIFERNRLFVIQQDWALGLFKGRDLTRRGRQSPLAVVKAK